MLAAARAAGETKTKAMVSICGTAVISSQTPPPLPSIWPKMIGKNAEFIPGTLYIIGYIVILKMSPLPRRYVSGNVFCA